MRVTLDSGSWLLGLVVLTVGILVPLVAVARANKLFSPRSKRSS